MVITNSIVTEYKGINILVEKTDNNKILYSIPNNKNYDKYMVFRTLKDIKNYIDTKIV